MQLITFSYPCRTEVIIIMVTVESVFSCKCFIIAVCVCVSVVSRPISAPLSRLPPRPISPPVSRPVSRPITRPVSRPISHPVSRPISRPISRPVSRPVSLPPSHQRSAVTASSRPISPSRLTPRVSSAPCPQRSAVGPSCAHCGGYRYVPCRHCHGGKRSLHRAHCATEFCALRCSVCDENGLLRCSACNTAAAGGGVTAAGAARLGEVYKGDEGGAG